METSELFRCVRSRLFPINRKPINNGLLILKNDVIIYAGKYNKKILKTYGIVRTNSFDGTILPGFINAHMHLELSRLKGKIEPTSKGFTDWLSRFDSERAIVGSNCNISDELQKMQEYGIVGIGEITNTGTTLAPLKESGLMGIVFLEFYDRLGNKKIILPEEKDILPKKGLLTMSISPHAIYSTSAQIIEQILQRNSKNSRKTALHLAEDMDEMKFYEAKDTPLQKYLQKRWGQSTLDINSAGNFYHQFINKPGYENLVLVHNTHISAKNIYSLSTKGTYFILCPRSNLFIGGKLPPINDFFNITKRIGFGTDSLASNSSLDVREEAKLIHKLFPAIPSSKLVYALTYGGANALKITKYYGLKKGSHINSIICTPAKITNCEILLEEKLVFKKAINLFC